MDFMFNAVSEATRDPYFLVFACACVALITIMVFKEKLVDQNTEQKGKKKRRLVILDMNNVLVHRVFRYGLDEPDKDPRIKTMLDSAVAVGKFYTWDRPGRRDFVNYCLDNFDVAVWSSAWHQNVDLLCSHVFGDRRKELAFEWDQARCKAVLNDAKPDRPTFLKPISTVFSEFPGRWDDDSVLIVDDAVSKMAANPTGYYVIADAWSPLEEHPEIVNGLLPGSIVRKTLDKFLTHGNGVFTGSKD